METENNGRPIAELAYWNGEFIKALYFNYEGRFYGIDDNRNADIFDEAHDIYTDTGGFPWYLDAKR